MGLHVEFESPEYLLDSLYPGEPEFQSRVLLALREHICPRQSEEEWISTIRALGPEEGALAFDGPKIGTYGAIMNMRFVVSRLAGYTLDEAFALEIPEQDLGRPSDDDPEEGDNMESGSADEEVASDLGLSAGSFMSGEKRDPFPFYQLVCFSDCEGVYLPLDFDKPVVVAGYHYGSSSKLLEELVNASDLVQRVKGRSLEEMRVLKHVGVTIGRLLEPCKASVNMRFPMVFI